MNKPEIRLVPYNEKMVSVTVGNQTYSISEKKDKELIYKGKDYKKLLSRKNPIPKNFLYGLWINIYKESSYNFYLEPIQMKLFDSKWKRAINIFLEKKNGENND